MLIFDQLRISDDGKYMYIDMHVNTSDYFKDIYIQSITITTADKALETSPTEPKEYLYKKEVEEEGVKELSLVLTVSDFIKSWEKNPVAINFTQSDMSKTLFFVYAKCGGVPDVCTPCTLDNEITLGVVFHEVLLYQRIMDFTKKLLTDCSVNQDFIDFILLWNAFKASIETEHYVSAVKFWNILFKTISKNNKSTTYKFCNCL